MKLLVHKVLPYVYKLTHKETGEFYIGYRAANKVYSSNDLGCKYFSSSKKVKSIGFENFNIEIVAEFFAWEDAYDFEQGLIKEHFKDPLCLNRNYNINNISSFNTLGKRLSNLQKEHLSKINSGKKHSIETKNKISNLSKDRVYIKNESLNICKFIKRSELNRFDQNEGWELGRLSKINKNIAKGNTGKQASEETRHRMSLARRNVIVTPETKNKLSMLNKGKNNPMYGRDGESNPRRIFSDEEELKMYVVYKAGLSKSKIHSVYKEKCSLKTICTIINKLEKGL